ncbi:hypothetical protein [Paraburkholderia hospita]|uniref:hypothetical protein n=1 Tax=Paraburkholderia hospita TaxID=169430 RepID=UPI001054AA64|nr:hypothetical protein [Paraburkholderia hospita]
MRFKLAFGFALFCSGFMCVLGKVFMPLRWHPCLSLRGAGVGFGFGLLVFARASALLLRGSCFRWHP